MKNVSLHFLSRVKKDNENQTVKYFSEHLNKYSDMHSVVKYISINV